jgi:hypothetical protein
MRQKIPVNAIIIQNIKKAVIKIFGKRFEKRLMLKIHKNNSVFRWRFFVLKTV